MNRQEHLLTILAEECAEVAQRVSKALRFGLSEIQPGQPLTNAERITEELCDLFAVTILCTEAGLFPAPDSVGVVSELVAAKRAKIERFMEISRREGTLTEPAKEEARHD